MQLRPHLHGLNVADYSAANHVLKAAENLT
jgi:hypothetical protein